MLWSLGAFLLLLAVLAVQVRAGGDPALGPAKPAAQAERRVIVHRVILRRVVVTERAPAEAGSPGGSASAPAAAGGSGGSPSAAGYATSRVGAEPASLDDTLRAAPPRRSATPGRRWREIAVGDATISRPPGLRIDLGGSAKGLAADWAASRLATSGRFAVDCGGDVRVVDGAVATSGIDRRVWRRADGSFAHHLLDPGTGESAWTGLISATALAPTALEAEALAKAALLSGPQGARRVLAARGGILVHDDGRSDSVGPAAAIRLEAGCVGPAGAIRLAAEGHGRGRRAPEAQAA